MIDRNFKILNHKLIILLLLSIIIIFISNNLKAGILNYKPFFCNYVDGVLNNQNLLETGDPCLEGGESQYKIYVNKKFLSKKKCNSYIEEYGNTKSMKSMYPSEKWMIGCDKKW